MQAALTVACLDARVADMPLGLDTWLGESGGILSGGERKRLSLARALLAERPWLVLDEPTEGLDAATEAELIGRLCAWLDATGTGLLLASHRPAPLASRSAGFQLRRPSERTCGLRSQSPTRYVPHSTAGLPRAPVGRQGRPLAVRTEHANSRDGALLRKVKAGSARECNSATMNEDDRGPGQPTLAVGAPGGDMTFDGLQHAVRPYLVAVAATGLAAGIAARAAGAPGWAEGLWAAATLPVLAALLAEIVTSLRRGDLGLDIVAALSMTAALVFGETLAAAVVALMYAGGQYLELFAERRARREMTALLARAPRTAMRHRDGGLEEVRPRGDRARRPAADPAGRRGAGGRHRGRAWRRWTNRR